MELIGEEPKFIKYNKDETFLRDDSDYCEKPDFEDIMDKYEENEQDIENIINKYSKDVNNKKKKDVNSNKKINDNNSLLYKPENTAESSNADEKTEKSADNKNKAKNNKHTNSNSKTKPPICNKNNKNNSKNKNNNCILTSKKKTDIPNSYLQTEKSHLNEDSISNYEESKNYKLDLNNLKLNLDLEDKSKNSFIDPVTQRECSFIQTSDLNNSNFLEDDNHNKENEVVVCISNLDMKIEDSQFNNNFFPNKNNPNSANRINNFLQKLNKNPSNNFDENNFYGNSNIKSIRNNAFKSNNDNNEINFKDNSSIKSKFEEIQLSLSKIKNKREKNLFINPNNSGISNKNDIHKKLNNKFDIEKNQTNSNRSNNKEILSTRNEKALDSQDVDSEYLETDENIKVYRSTRRRRFIFVFLFILFILAFLAVLMYFFILRI